jgi:large subunit ribosomal protein L5
MSATSERSGEGQLADGNGESKGTAAPAPAPVRPRLQKRYREEIVPALMQQFSYSAMQVPRLEKIVVNMGLGEAVREPKIIEIAVEDLQTIAGQKPIVTKARKSIAGFKLRAGVPIGAKVTLRGARMWEFCDRLLSVALPRIRDFRGLNPDAFDGAGNYTLGVTEQLIFPEIDYDKVQRQLGMDITIVTTARNNAEGEALLRALGFPLRERVAAGEQANQ